MDNTSERKTLNYKELSDNGFITELNRLLFHPIGLAIGTKKTYNDDLSEVDILHIFDCSDEEFGIEFNDDPETTERILNKYNKFQEFIKSRIEVNRRKRGYTIQPFDKVYSEEISVVEIHETN